MTMILGPDHALAQLAASIAFADVGALPSVIRLYADAGAATGATPEEVETQIREAIVFHLQGLREDGIPAPTPVSRVEYVEIAA